MKHRAVVLGARLCRLPRGWEIGPPASPADAEIAVVNAVPDLGSLR
ncbi:hypothetical protein [Streptomyces atroolivaceus]|uniref:Uncharacterized protein n=1 Tax=Streptomyces atroolivaceus TaxID=66869 RepID=A0ABV9VLT4_STRAZ|nr:hypothetical protein [Streptomyces atroolivaceus]